ncbi:MAG: phosphodiester glycosidase family protein [Myxococcota bacterium]
MSELLHQLVWVSRLFGGGVVLMAVGWFLRRWPRLATLPAAFGGVIVIYAISIPAAYIRPRPPPQTTDWFRGVEYLRYRVDAPVRQMVHVVRVDLAQPGVRVMVTPGASVESKSIETSSVARWPIGARKTTEFLAEFDQQIAVNAGFFYECWSSGPFHYYPRSGDGVGLVGRSVALGTEYSPHDPSTQTLWFFEGRAEVTDEFRAAPFGVSGYPLLIEGKIPPAVVRTRGRHPRVAAGVDSKGRTLIFVVIDGRAPFYSEGATLLELAERMRQEGGFDAINLDGGGSSTLVRRDTRGAPEIVNLPVHGRMPSGFERPVANHIGISGLTTMPSVHFNSEGPKISSPQGS